MIFKRRERPTLPDRIREFLSPRKGFWRGLDYIGKRMRRLPDSPHRIALGFACGAVASFTPFFGFHFFVAAGIAWLLRGNILASLFGTIIGNPLTFPLISGLSLWLGRMMMGRHSDESDFSAITHAFAAAFNDIWATARSWVGYGPSMVDGLAAFFWDVFLPYLIGGLVPGLFSGVVCYFLLGPLVAAYQERRRKKILATQERQRRAAEREAEAYRTPDGM